MGRKMKQMTKTAEYLGVRIYVREDRTDRATKVKNALNHRDSLDLGVRDTNDKIYLRGLESYEKELSL